jgi:hypothetical protein
MVVKGFAEHGLTGSDHQCLCDPFQGRRYFFHALAGGIAGRSTPGYILASFRDAPTAD